MILPTDFVYITKLNLVGGNKQILGGFTTVDNTVCARDTLTSRLRAHCISGADAQGWPVAGVPADAWKEAISKENQRKRLPLLSQTLTYKLCQASRGASGNSSSGYCEELSNCLYVIFLTFSVNNTSYPLEI